MPLYRKKPVVISAVQLNPDQPAPDGVRFGHPENPALAGKFWIDTLEGAMIANPGDYIITGIKGEKYPCKPDIFEATYEALASDGPLNYLISQVTGTEAFASVIAERAKQIKQWGYQHDDEHLGGELALAASHIANPNAGQSMATDGYLPWAVALRNKYEDDPRKRLVIAAALLLAEIEKMDRQTNKPE